MEDWRSIFKQDSDLAQSSSYHRENFFADHRRLQDLGRYIYFHTLARRDVAKSWEILFSKPKIEPERRHASLGLTCHYDGLQLTLKLLRINMMNKHPIANVVVCSQSPDSILIKHLAKMKAVFVDERPLASEDALTIVNLSWAYST